MVTTQVLAPKQEEESHSSVWQTMSLSRIAALMLTISVAWRIVDQFLLGLGSTWMNIFPSKLFPFLIILGFFWKYRPNEMSSVLGLSRERIRTQVVIGLVIGIILAIGIDLGGTMVHGIFFDPTYPLQLHVLNGGLLGYLFLFFFTNALLEETLFRGLLINSFKINQSVNRSIILSACIFGFWHAGWPLVNGAVGQEAIMQVTSMVFFTTVLGLFFGVYYQRFNSSRSLVGPIVVHTLINFVGECFKIGPEPTIQGPDIVFSNNGLMIITFLMFLLTFIPLTLFLWKYRIEEVTSFWQRHLGRERKEEHIESTQDDSNIK